MSGREALTAESEALLTRMERAGWTFGLRDELAERLAAIEAAAVARHIRETGCEGLREAARDVWEHWAHGIGWFDGYDGTRPDKTAIHLTQMTVEDEQEMTRRMDVLAECLGLGERYYEGAPLAPTVAASEEVDRRGRPWPVRRGHRPQPRDRGRARAQGEHARGRLPMTPPPDAAVAALAEALAFVPEPFEIRRGVSAGGEPVWGPPEPGSYTVQKRAESVLAMLAAAGWTLSRRSEQEALVAALDRNPYTAFRNCFWCERHDYEIHADDCAWVKARAALVAGEGEGA